MKLIIHIFTLYLLALSLVPCGDGGGGIVEMINDVFEIEHEHMTDHEQHSQGCNDDACSPFCICSCCSTVMDSPVKLPLTLKALVPTPEAQPFFIPHILHFSFKYSIWQPPKLS